MDKSEKGEKGNFVNLKNVFNFDNLVFFQKSSMRKEVTTGDDL